MLTSESRPTLDSYLNTLPHWASTDQVSNDKIHSLFRAFPEQKTKYNAPGYDEKMNFWRKVLIDACGKGLLGNEVTCFDAEGLESRFKRRGLAPLGLDVVVADMVRTGDLVPLAKYRDTEGWGSWAVSTLIVSPISWGISKVIGSSESNAKTLHGAYVSIPTITELSNTILSNIRNEAHYASDYVLSFTDFQSKFNILIEAHMGKEASALDFELVRRHLETTGEMVVSEDMNKPDHGVVKIRPAKKTNSFSLTITEADRGIVHMKSMAATLHHQIDELESKIVDLTRQAQERLRAKQKERALYHIRQKKMITEILKKRIGSLETIEGIVSKMQHGETESEVLSAYQIGSNSLKSFAKENNLTAESVEDTMDALQDTLADQEEVDNAITMGQNAILKPEEDEELEQELEGLLVKEMEAKLPEVPDTVMPAVEPKVTLTQHEPRDAHTAALDAELDGMLEEERRVSKVAAEPLLA